jgi:hypothetical protein
MNTPKPKTPRASRINLAQLMQPEHANNHGNVHGGWIMKLVDEAGALACMRHAQRRVVTVAVDSLCLPRTDQDRRPCHPHRRSHLRGAHLDGSRSTGHCGEPHHRRAHPHQHRLPRLCRLGRRQHPTSIPQLVAETDEEKQARTRQRQRQQRRIAPESDCPCM